MDDGGGPRVYSETRHDYNRSTSPRILGFMEVRPHETFSCCTTYEFVPFEKDRKEDENNLGLIRATLVEKTERDEGDGSPKWIKEILTIRVPDDCNPLRHAFGDEGFEDLNRYLRILYTQNAEPKKALPSDVQSALLEDELLFIEHVEVGEGLGGSGFAQDMMRAFQQAIQEIPLAFGKNDWSYRGPAFVSPAPMIGRTESLRASGKTIEEIDVIKDKIANSYKPTGFTMFHKANPDLDYGIDLMIGRIGGKPGDPTASEVTAPKTHGIRADPVGTRDRPILLSEEESDGAEEGEMIWRNQVILKKLSRRYQWYDSVGPRQGLFRPLPIPADSYRQDRLWQVMQAGQPLLHLQPVPAHEQQAAHGLYVSAEKGGLYYITWVVGGRMYDAWAEEERINRDAVLEWEQRTTRE